MQKIFLILMFAALGQWCKAAKLVTAPDGRWSIQITNLESKPAIAIFNSSGRPVVIVDRDTTGSTQFAAKWSPDSNKVVLLDQAPLGSGITAAWFDGTKWHATVEPDSDLSQAEALANSQGITGDVKAEERTLGDWISPDTIQIRGKLRYLGGKQFPYSYNLQIIPGSYTTNRGSFETGGLKASHFQAGS
jgi:hypothetical protein